MKHGAKILLKLCRWGLLGVILILVIYGDSRNCLYERDLYLSLRECTLSPMRRAVTDFSGAIKIAALAVRGLASEQLGDAARARADFEAALAAHPEDEATAAPLRFLVRRIGDRVAITGLARLAEAVPATTPAPTVSVPDTAHGVLPPAMNLPYEIVPMIGDAGGLYRLVFSPDGRIVASGKAITTVEEYSGAYSITLWDVTAGRLLRKFRFYNEPADFDFSPDGCTLVLGNADPTVKLWDNGSGHSLNATERTCAGPRSSGASAKDRKLAATIRAMAESW